MATSFALKSANIRSCGCLQVDARKRDYAGHRAGALVALHPTDKIYRNSVVWRWKCDCGREIDATLDSALYCGRRSCGCRNRSIKQSQAIAMQLHCLRVDGTDVSRIEANKTPINNTSGQVGVSFNSVHNKWYARIQFKRCKYWLGAYNTKIAAIKIRRKAEKMYFETFLKWYKKINKEKT